MSAIVRNAYAVASSFALACSGVIGEPGASVSTDSPDTRDAAAPPGTPDGYVPPPMRLDPEDVAEADCTGTEITLGEIPARRLSRVEYLNTIDDLLFGLSFTRPDVPADSSDGGFENAARLLSASPLHVEAYELTATTAAEAAMTQAAIRSQVLGCTSWSTPTEQAECTERFLDGFAMRAFRRPLSPEERARYATFIRAQTDAIDFEAAIELTVAALLQSPQLMYRIEHGEGGQVSPHEMASRLSYLLWQSMPDAQLLSAAEAGALSTPEQLGAQVERMLLDPRARAAMTDFFRQWLDFDRIDREAKDSVAFPTWSPALVASAKEEVSRFVEHVVFDGEGTLGALLTSRTSFVDGPLAALYGLPPVTGWTQVELPATERAGILTRSAFLAGHSHSANPSPILRGVFVSTRLLCAEFAAPPDNADTSVPEAPPGSGPMTNRMLFEERTSPQTCAQCHAAINGIGFGFEHFDAVGAFRSVDNTLPVDASGNIASGSDVDGPYDGAIELSTRLGRSSTLQSCAAINWVQYALGRRPTEEDACFVQRAARSLEQSDGDVRRLLVELVMSPEFPRGVQ